MSLLDRVQRRAGDDVMAPVPPRAEAPPIPRVRPAPNPYAALRNSVRQRLVEELADEAEDQSAERIRRRIAELVDSVAAESDILLSRGDRERIIHTVNNDVLGLGPLESLLADPAITEVMVNGPDQIYVEQRGKIVASPTVFESNDQLLQVIDRIVSRIGRRVDESSPMVDARLQDGSRVNVILPPLSLSGPVVTIRKFTKGGFTMDDLVRIGTLTPDMVTFLRACVRARLNVLVIGGTGSGKTTTLNALSAFIPANERIITIEDAAELQLRQDHVIALETRPANVEGRGRVSVRELLINSLRMRPDRIVVGECRGGEALDMLQAMNTGHDGSMTTIHANSALESISRLETMVLMAGTDLPTRAIREQIASAIDIIVHQSRLRDGSRRVVNISEVLGFDGEHVLSQEVFVFHQTGVDEEGRVLGRLSATGTVPKVLEQLIASGEGVAEEIFRPAA